MLAVIIEVSLPNKARRCIRIHPSAPFASDQSDPRFKSRSPIIHSFSLAVFCLGFGSSHCHCSLSVRMCFPLATKAGKGKRSKEAGSRSPTSSTAKNERTPDLAWLASAHTHELRRAAFASTIAAQTLKQKIYGSRSRRSDEGRSPTSQNVHTPTPARALHAPGPGLPTREQTELEYKSRTYLCVLW